MNTGCSSHRRNDEHEGKPRRLRDLAAVRWGQKDDLQQHEDGDHDAGLDITHTRKASRDSWNMFERVSDAESSREEQADTQTRDDRGQQATTTGHNRRQTVRAKLKGWQRSVLFSLLVPHCFVTWVRPNIL